jgi:hypothetical protein
MNAGEGNSQVRPGQQRRPNVARGLGRPRRCDDCAREFVQVAAELSAILASYAETEVPPSSLSACFASAVLVACIQNHNRMQGQGRDWRQ